MASFNFTLQEPYVKGKSGEKKLNPNETRLYLFVIHDRENKVKIKTEFNVIPKEWDFKKQRIKHQVSGALPVNGSIEMLKEKVTDLFNKLRFDFPNMKFDEIASNLKEYVKTDIAPVYSEKNKNFFQVFDDYIEAKRLNVSPLTIKKYNTLRKSLVEFDSGITFDKIDLTFFDKYIHYLRTKKPVGRQKNRKEGFQDGLLNDTASKYIENLKNFLKWSYERGKHTNTMHVNSEFYVTRKPKNDIVTLKLDELKQLYEFDLSNNPRLERVRDVFCFGCFTGQRWSDIERFNKSDIVGDRWKFEAYKVKKMITVPLVGYASPAMDILKKYKFELPVISSQKFNEYLKELGELVGLDRHVQIKRYIGKREIIFDEPLFTYISSHTARRTAVSLLLNVENMPINKVRDITGHSSLKTLDKYIDKDEEALEDSMAQTKGINATMRIIKNEAI